MRYLTLLFCLSLISIVLSKSLLKESRGRGLYVSGNKLYDGKGNEFIFRGVNIPHAWFLDKTESSIKDIASLGANSARFVLATGAVFQKSTQNEVENIINWCEEYGLICVFEVHDFTGSDDPENITKDAVNYWNELKDLFNDHKDYVIVNIANEWLGSWNKGELWEETYIKAVQDMRRKGIENAIMIDASGYGQESGPIINSARRVLEADPDKNIIFSYHVYAVLGKDDDSLYAGLDGLKNTGVCFIVGEFGWYHSGADVAYKTLTKYCQENNIGWIVWSWAGNGGFDMVLDLVSPRTFSKNDMTGFGKFIFYSEYGIQRTSKMAYTNKSYSGEIPEIVNEVKGVYIPVSPVGRSTSLDVPIDVGELTKYDWDWVIKADLNNKVKVTTFEKLSNKGIRANIDLNAENYPTMTVWNDNGFDLSSHSTINLVIRNNNAKSVQIYLILKAGSYKQSDGSFAPKWYEPNSPMPYIEVSGLMTEKISFNIKGVGSDLNNVKQISFIIQITDGKANYPIDICHMGFDEKEDSLKEEIKEMNRPKSADYFTWSYPDTSAAGTEVGSVKVENGVIKIPYDVEIGIYGGCHTEAKPGSSIGLDFSNYKMIKATFTNKGTSPVRCIIIIRTGRGWSWNEGYGARTLGGIENQEQIINGGESINVYYYLNHSSWKTERVNQFNDKLTQLDDVRAMAFRVYDNGEVAKGVFEISNFEVLNNEEK